MLLYRLIKLVAYMTSPTNNLCSQTDVILWAEQIIQEKEKLRRKKRTNNKYNDILKTAQTFSYLKKKK